MIRRMLMTLLPAVVLAAPAAAQDPDTSRTAPGPWTYDATTALNLSQSAYSSNWDGGDKGSINWVLQGDLKAARQMSHWFNLSNLLQLSYGQTSQQVIDPENRNRIVFDSPEKTTDLILFESTGRFTLDTWVDPFLGFRLESQFSDQTDPDRSLRFNPVRLSQTAGVARVLIKEEKREWITRLGFTVRETFNRAFADTVGDETESFSSMDGGIEWLTTVDQPVVPERILYKGRLLVYLPLFYDNSGALEDFDDAALMFDPSRERIADFWKAPNVNFQNTFTAPLTKNLNVNLLVQWVYEKFDDATPVDPDKPIADQIGLIDAGIRKAGQFKETLAIGLTYALF